MSGPTPAAVKLVCKKNGWAENQDENDKWNMAWVGVPKPEFWKKSQAQPGEIPAFKSRYALVTPTRIPHTLIADYLRPPVPIPPACELHYGYFRRDSQDVIDGQYEEDGD